MLDSSSLPGVSKVARALSAGDKGRILTFVALGWLLTVGTRFVFPALFPYIRDDFQVELSTLGVLFTIVYAMYGVGQFPAGIVGDRIGDRAVLTLSTLFSSGALLAVGFATGLWSLIVGAFLFGASSALYGPARFTVLTRIYSDYDGTAIGLTQMAGHTGNTLLPALAGIIATAFAWQFGFLYIAPLFMVIAVSLWFTVPEQGGDAQAETTVSVGSWFEVVAATFFPLSVLITVILALTMFVIQATTGFYPTYLVEIKGLSSPTAATLYALFFATSAVIQPVAGAMGDTIGTRNSLLIVLGILAVSLPLLTVAATVAQLVVVTILLSSVMGIAPIAIPRLTNALPGEIRGTGLGLLRSGYFVFGSSGPLIVGRLADRGLFDESFYLLALLTSVAFAFALLLNRVTERGAR